MKKATLLGLFNGGYLIPMFLLFCLNSFGQQSVLKGQIFNEKSEKIEGAFVVKNGVNTTIQSSIEGLFFLEVDPGDIIYVVKNGSNDVFNVPEIINDSVYHAFHLSIKTYLLDEVQVTSSRVEFVAGDYNENILDYFVFEDGGMALLKKYKKNYFLSIQNNYLDKIDFKLPFIPVEFFTDCGGNLRIVSKDSTYSYKIDSTLHILGVTSNSEVKNNLKKLIHCNENEYVYYDLLNFNRKYRLIYENDQTSQLIKEFYDSIGDFNIYEQYNPIIFQDCSQPGRIDRGVSLKHQWQKNSQQRIKVCSPENQNPGNIKRMHHVLMDLELIEKQINKAIEVQSFSVSDKIVTLDQINKTVHVFNAKGKLLFEAPYQATQEYKIATVDPYAKRIYLHNDDEPKPVVTFLDITSGKTMDAFTFEDVQFPKKVKVFANKAYYLASNNSGFNKLYSIRVLPQDY